MIKSYKHHPNWMGWKYKKVELFKLRITKQRWGNTKRYGISSMLQAISPIINNMLLAKKLTAQWQMMMSGIEYAQRIPIIYDDPLTASFIGFMPTGNKREDMPIIKLTPQERVDIYNKIIDVYVEQHNGNLVYHTSGRIRHMRGICHHLNKALKDKEAGFIDYDTLTEVFPEVFKLIPEGVSRSQYWFDMNNEGLRQRIDLLTEAVLLIQNQK